MGNPGSVPDVTIVPLMMEYDTDLSCLVSPRQAHQAWCPLATIVTYTTDNRKEADHGFHLPKRSTGQELSLACSTPGSHVPVDIANLIVGYYEAPRSHGMSSTA